MEGEDLIKNHQRLLNCFQVILDAGVIIWSYVLAWYIRFYSGIFVQDAGVLSGKTYMKALIFLVPGYLVLYYIFKIYTPRRSRSRRTEAWNIVRANTVGIAFFALTLYLVGQEDFSRNMLFLFYCGNILWEIVFRNLVRFVLRRIRQQGFNQKHILLVGNSRATQQYLDRIRKNPQWGYQVFGILSKDYEKQLEKILSEHSLDEIVITLGMKEYDRLEAIVAICEKSGVHTKFIPDYGNVIPTRPHIEDIQGVPVINIRKVPLKVPVNRWIKRTVDLIGALVALLLFSPVMLITAIGIKTSTKGPVIFKQERVGLNNQTFCMYKFCSMVVQDEESEKKAWSTKNDPRITPIGKWIRKNSVDELPQLFNVLKGDMSLVGPRPERPQFVEKFKDEIPRYMVKHQVCPGMTGWAQINGYRGDTSIEKRIEYDLYYIENWNLGLDLKILIYTLFKGFRSE